MPPVSYPLDPTGLSSANKVVDEIHVLTEINDTTYRIIVPEFAPFYLDNFELKHVTLTGDVTVLIPDVDYYPCLPYIGATRSIGKMLYGGITFNTDLVNGVLKVTYQTLGGDWTADANYVLNVLAERVYNPRMTVWDIVTNKPNAFPPINHDQNLDYVFGHQELIDSINGIASTILNTPNPTTGIIQHLVDENNPHGVTKAQIGLGDVVNYPIATDLEVQNRAVVDKYITLKQLLQFPIPSDIDPTPISAHLTNTNNPHAVSKAQVGLGNVVNLSLANDTEVIAHADVDKYLTLRQTLMLVTELTTRINNMQTTIDTLSGAPTGYITPETYYLTQKLSRS